MSGIALIAKNQGMRVSGSDLRASRYTQQLTEAGIEISYDKPAHAQSAPAAEFLRMEAEWESGYLLTVRSAWQADNKIPNSKEASMGKAKAARVGSDITLKAVEMAGTVGYSEQSLLELERGGAFEGEILQFGVVG